MATFICGLDLGKVRDATALAILEKTAEGESPGKAIYDLRHLERWPLGTDYPAICAQVAARFRQAPLAGSLLAVDGTGAGIPVVDLLRQQNMPVDLRPTMITGGNQARKDEQSGWWHISKGNLVAALRVVSQGKRLRIAKGLPEYKTLRKEIPAFEVKVTKAAHEIYDTRESAHDDLLLALALANWFAESLGVSDGWDWSRSTGGGIVDKAPRGVFGSIRGERSIYEPRND